MIHISLELNNLYLILLAFVSKLRIVSYATYNRIFKFQRKITRKTVIIGMVLFGSFCYIHGKCILSFTSENFIVPSAFQEIES